MPGGNKNIKPEDNINGFQNNPQNINRNGRPVSIHKQLRSMLGKEGEIFIPEKQVIDFNAEDAKGNKGIKIKIPTTNSLALKLLSWAMSNKTQSLKAIEMIMDRIDGKAQQNTKLTIENEALSSITPLTFVKNDKD